MEILENNKNIKEQGLNRDKRVEEHYYSIQYLKPSLMSTFLPGEIIWVEEKIDGSNTSIKLQPNTLEPRIFGKRFELSPEYNNQGAYFWLLSLQEKIKQNYGSRYVFYFEYLFKHHVKYPKEKYNKGYLISVFDLATHKYLDEDTVFTIADKLEVEHAPLLFKGKFANWGDLYNILGQSKLGALKAEGIVVKAYDKVHGQKMIKIVTKDFQEIMNQNIFKHDNKVKKSESKKSKAEEIVTQARIRKCLYRLIEDSIIKNPDIETWTKEDKQLAIKYIGKLIYNDCEKEEPDFIKSFGKDFGNFAFIISREFILNI